MSIKKSKLLTILAATVIIKALLYGCDMYNGNSNSNSETMVLRNMGNTPEQRRIIKNLNKEVVISEGEVSTAKGDLTTERW